MKHPDTTRALKLALTHDPRCQVYLAKATTFAASYRVAYGEYASPYVLRTLRSLMRSEARAAVAHARTRLSYYLQCVPRPEIAA
jgi:hypothetical protein